MKKPKIMNHKFKRLTQKIGIKVLLVMDPSKYEGPKNDFTQEALAICRKLASKPTSTLLISPI